MNRRTFDRIDEVHRKAYAEAEKVVDRGKRLLAAIEANPGKWPEVERAGIRAEDHGDGDPSVELDRKEERLKAEKAGGGRG